MNGFISNSELVKEEEALAATEAMAIAEADMEANGGINNTEIASYIQACWTKARDAKEQGAEKQILANMRQIDGAYDAEKLAKIKEIGGSEVFMMITDAKVKNASYWVNDILFRPGQKPFGVDPSPIPDLPDEVKAEIYSQLMIEIAYQLSMETAQTGLKPTPQMLRERVGQLMPLIEKQAQSIIISRAKEISKITELKIDDKLHEGEWYQALKKTVYNVIMHTGFLKGPVMKMRDTTRLVTNKQTGEVEKIVERKPIPTWEARHPLYIYPSPNSTNVNDGYLIDRTSLTPIALQELIGVEGYNSAEIMAVLEEAKNGKLAEWLQVDQSLRDINDENSVFTYDSDKMDCLEFWGYVSGDMLIKWGLTTNIDGEPLDGRLYYNVIAYKIGTHVIKITMNPGKKLFYKASFEDREGSFWGRGLPEVIKDVQTICNACARAIVNNVGIASGPQVERNIDRIPATSRADNYLRPWKVWDVTEGQMVSPAPALKFYQPPMVVDKLMTVYNQFSKIGDEHSGVPAYAHGDPNVGGAGNTSSGLSMLMGAAARGIKGLVTNIDENIIAPSVKSQYEWLVENEGATGFVCDYNIITLGTHSALAREQLAARRMEFMQLAANPLFAPLIGQEGFRYLLKETAESISLDLNRVFQEQQQQPPQQEAPGVLPPQKSAELDQSGAPVSGQDVAGQGPTITPEPRAFGGPVEPNKPYVVGESGAEVFVPNQPGTILPNSNAMGNISYNSLRPFFTNTYFGGSMAIPEFYDMQDPYMQLAKNDSLLDELYGPAQQYNVPKRGYLDQAPVPAQTPQNDVMRQENQWRKFENAAGGIAKTVNDFFGTQGIDPLKKAGIF